ncbi:MAG: SMC-Scp complex subunit ScpB [Nitrospinota bacterium]|nr:SMC-Scp complex subunit ScpB [Nitrospinota bacterium]
MEPDDAKAVIENILFVADSPLPTARIVTVFGGEMTEEQVVAALAELTEEYSDRSLRIVEVAEGWRMQTRPEYAPWIATFFKMEKGQKLTRASLEVLAIVAYRQPITRTEMDEIRGVDCGGVLRGLIDKGLVKTMGRRRAPGKPMMYGTTSKFLEFFGLARLSDLPTLDEFRAELGDAMEMMEAAQARAEQKNANQPGLPFDGDESSNAEDASAEDTSVEDASAEDASVEDTSVEDASVEDATDEPAEEEMASEENTEDESTNDQPADHEPANDDGEEEQAEDMTEEERMAAEGNSRDNEQESR